MRIAVVGGGVLGLVLGYRLAGRGHQVEILEAAPAIGGLAGSHDYGPFVWDRFYHCILPQDAHLIALLEELGLAGELCWTRTRTGYFARNRFFSMSGHWDFLRFPLLTAADKVRLGASVLYATRVARPESLHRITAREWLTRLCGRAAFEIFWRPLLRAKFGAFQDRVAAVFIHATLARLFGARSAAAGKESLGYVRGGYRRILSRLDERLRDLGAAIRTGSPVVAISPVVGDWEGCRVVRRDPGGAMVSAEYDQVVFTAPTRLARKVAAPAYAAQIDQAERDHPAGETYLGIACLALVLDRPLTPYYVLNIGEPAVELTGLVEMTNLIDPKAETGGLHLVYLPRYLDSESEEMGESDSALRDGMIDRGLKRLFPDFDVRRARYCGIHRARYVQPLPLVRSGPVETEERPLKIARPFQIVNTSMLRCATLNNNEVVALADRVAGAMP